ncbi:hypothetical protein N0V93_008040 [Gnomoniopsis smithogilvyi]|uniref:Phytanoyl-CoA dioxygenase n=1 Tax=Gnomoniopsis smithogilvyi TaxID=1191159 RepID=A0A9W8YM67_9PEZI|nr:hypothetical protein N0V93_008040 [Gnomoniopsis smithogilvyi]
MSRELDAPKVITPTDKERRAGVYLPRNLHRVLGALHQDGLVVLRDVIEKDHIDSLNTVMSEDAERRLQDPTQAFNHNSKSNFLQRPPLTDAALLYEDVYFNSFLLQVANAYLGQKPIWNWLTANTAVANTAGIRQPEHKDSAYDHPKCPYYFIANVPLCDFTVENGATEFWLGSHVNTTVEDQQTAPGDGPYSNKMYKAGEHIPWIHEDAKRAQRAIRPPIQPEALRGDIMIRDLRTWHAGMPNNSDCHRIMLGLGYQSPFHPNYKQRLHFPISKQEYLLGQAKNMVEVRANFYGDDEFEKSKADTYFDISPQYGADE